MGEGGKGMRMVTSADSLIRELETAKKERRWKLWRWPSHSGALYSSITAHLSAAGGWHDGNYLHFFDRDCTVQRRHQKLIEETPSMLSDSQRILQPSSGLLQCRDRRVYLRYWARQVLLNGDEHVSASGAPNLIDDHWCWCRRIAAESGGSREVQAQAEWHPNQGTCVWVKNICLGTLKNFLLDQEEWVFWCKLLTSSEGFAIDITQMDRTWTWEWSHECGAETKSQSILAKVWHFLQLEEKRVLLRPWKRSLSTRS